MQIQISLVHVCKHIYTTIHLFISLKFVRVASIIGAEHKGTMK